MPNLSIKNVPTEVIASMRERATANQRSLQGELLALVIQAAAGAQTASNLISAGTSDSSRDRRKGHKSIEQIAFEHRKHIKRPISKGKCSTELIRQDRDAR
jgi:plasmid stability protein